MYVVEVRNKTETVVIHDDRIPNNQAILGSESKVSASVGAAASFTFTIYPNNPGYNKLLEWVSYIDVINTQKNKYLFRGRVITIQPHSTSEGTFYKEVTCESQLAYLNDSIVTWQKVQMRPADFFKQLITSHNAQVDQERQFKFGRATVTNNTDNVYCYVEDGLKTLNELQTDLLTKEDLGGELWVRDEKDGTYIDWIRDEKKKADQEIKLAKNLISIQSKPELTGLVTVLYPFGASEEKSVSDENVHDVSTPRINISSVNNGKKYIEDPELISMYGRISGSKNWDDVKIPSNLLSKAREYLNSFKTLKIAYEIEAVDLAPLNLAVDDFQLGKYYHVINPVIGVDDWLRVVGVSININKPLLSTLQIGDQTKRLVDYQLNNINMTRAISSLRRSQQENLMQISQLQQENQTLARNYRNLYQANEQLATEFKEIKDLVDKMNDANKDVTEPINGDWTSVVQHAAKLMKVELTGDSLNVILSRIKQESGGDQTIVNNWDSNAQAGHPTIGLLQYRQDTFDYWAITGYQDIRKGFHQLLALFNDTNWLRDISVSGGWGPTGQKRYDSLPN
ncbi:phage tail protein [Ligilactobacillus murinus]|nr:phage tail protein [Ligilactobacillus murinus]